MSTSQGTSTKVEFIPVEHTDFIFAPESNRLFFAGVLVVIVLVWLGVRRYLSRREDGTQTRW